MEKVVLASESLFQSANGVWSTSLLVEIHNIVITVLWVSIVLINFLKRLLLILHFLLFKGLFILCFWKKLQVYDLSQN